MGTAARNCTTPVRTDLEGVIDISENNHTAPGTTDVAAAGKDRCSINTGSSIAQYISTISAEAEWDDFAH